MAERDLDRLRSLAAAQVAGEGPALLAGAVEEARRRVHAELVELAAEALRAEVLQPHGSGPLPAAAADEEGAEGPGDTGTAWYVYCVVGSGFSAPAGEPGIDPGHELQTIEHQGLAAVVSRVPLGEFDEQPLRERLSDMHWLERTVRSHERVVETVARQATAIPMRLCSVYRRADGVRAMLAREGASLRAALDRLAGTSEWGVKGFALADLPPAAAATTLENASRETEGTAYLQQRLRSRQRRAETDANRDRACRLAHEALAALALESRVNPVQRQELSGRDEPMVLNTAYLVRDADLTAFRSELERSAREAGAAGLELELTGPWPPYNFVPDAIAGSR
ncbi:MAG TPA: GvpL/GvpF family gas vesicle protein [Solirubrobacteraceae bacterium]|nr:GvpL/GvpF family gas vesicle protein [Solirubrobacteraceae bacterium]